jgi:hypothetical protein
MDGSAVCSGSPGVGYPPADRPTHDSGSKWFATRAGPRAGLDGSLL